MEERGFHESPNRMQVFREIAEALNQTNDISAAIEAILPRLGEALGLETAWAFRFDEHKRSFVEVGASGLPPALNVCHQTPLRTGWCECQDQFVHGRLGEAVNIVRCSRLKSATGNTGNLHFHASVPLRSKDKPLGILNLAAPGRTVFDEDALSFLQTVGQQVAVAVDRARMFQLERDKSSRLQRLAEVSAEWVGKFQPDTLLQRALESYVETFGYTACGVLRRETTGSAEMIAVAEAERNDEENVEAYVYPPTYKPTSVCDSILLADAQSAVTIILPLTTYELRLESRRYNAFNEVDREVFQAFAWQLAAAYAGTEAHLQTMRRAHLEERHRIASELHDSVSQRLFSAQLLLRTANMQMVNEWPKAGVTIERVGELLAESQQQMRALVRTLRKIDNKNSLATDLRGRVATLSMQQHPQVLLSMPEVMGVQPSPEVRTSLLAIVDEALHNALKHAEADTLSIQLRYVGKDTLVLTVKDDGIGCPQSAIGTGLGTRTMVERATAIGGKLVIDGQSGHGTSITIEVPVIPSEDDDDVR